MLIDRKIEETLIARNTVIFLLQQVGFVLNLKKSVLTPTQRIEFLGVAVDPEPCLYRRRKCRKFRSSV